MAIIDTNEQNAQALNILKQVADGAVKGGLFPNVEEVLKVGDAITTLSRNILINGDITDRTGEN